MVELFGGFLAIFAYIFVQIYTHQFHQIDHKQRKLSFKDAIIALGE